MNSNLSGATLVPLLIIIAISCKSNEPPASSTTKTATASQDSSAHTSGPFGLSLADSTDVSELLRRARWTHEPTLIIKQAVRLLDEKLDRDPQDKEAWLKLGEALSIGFADSKHAASATAAWQTAYEIDPTDCHAGALMTRSAARTQTEHAIRQLTLRHPRCAEAAYLTALFLPSSAATRARGLQDSIALMKSADALIALGQERIRTREWKLGLETFAEALQAQPLFPEDWRPDGWTGVHARLGLAWCHYSLRDFRQARREYEKFMGIFTDPGPWHDLSETEEGWHRALAERWPTVTGVQGVGVEKGQQ